MINIGISIYSFSCMHFLEMFGCVFRKSGVRNSIIELLESFNTILFIE